MSLIDDKSLNVKVVAAEALYGLGEKDAAVKTLSEVIVEGDEFESVVGRHFPQYIGKFPK